MQNNMTCFRVGSEYGDNVYECCEECGTQYADSDGSGWCTCMVPGQVRPLTILSS